MTDPIVEEVRKVRHDMERKAGHDFDRFVAMIREREKTRYRVNEQGQEK